MYKKKVKGQVINKVAVLGDPNRAEVLVNR